MFKIGQKVVCIKIDEERKLLVEGEIYTVLDINYNGSLMLKEVNSYGYKSGYFLSYRFRPINNDWVEELLCKIMSEVESDEFVSA